MAHVLDLRAKIGQLCVRKLNADPVNYPMIEAFAKLNFRCYRN